MVEPDKICGNINAEFISDTRTRPNATKFLKARENLPNRGKTNDPITGTKITLKSMYSYLITSLNQKTREPSSGRIAIISLGFICQEQRNIK